MWRRSRNPRGNPESCFKCGSWYHHLVSRAARRVFHSPEKLAVQGTHVQPDGGGPALGLGVELLRPSFGIDVDKSSLACHGPAVPLEPVGISRDDSFLVAVHVEDGSQTTRLTSSRGSRARRKRQYLAVGAARSCCSPCPCAALRLTLGMWHLARTGLGLRCAGRNRRARIGAGMRGRCQCSVQVRT